jgi:hypothetical protein
MRNKIALVGLLVALAGLAACSKTVEGETKAWERNQSELASLKALYPAFAAALDEQLKKAQTSMEAAQAAPEADRPKRMGEANALLSGGWVGQLRGLDREIKDVRAKITQATTGAKDESGRMAVRQVADDAQRVITQVEERLRQGAADAAGAQAIVSKLHADLQAAEKNVDTVIKSQEAAAKAAQAAAAAPAATDGGPAAAGQPPAAGQPAQPAQPAGWKCAYCGGMNDAALTKCQGCGAPKE